MKDNFLRVGDEKVVFNMKKMMKYPRDEEIYYIYFGVDILNDLPEEYKNKKLVVGSLKI